jgi:hypothetical protein
VVRIVTETMGILFLVEYSQLGCSHLKINLAQNMLGLFGFNSLGCLVSIAWVVWFWCQEFIFLEIIMFTPARDFLLETHWRIIIPNPNVNSHSL